MVKHLFFPSAVIVVLAAVPEVLPGHPPTTPDVQTSWRQPDTLSCNVLNHIYGSPPSPTETELLVGTRKHREVVRVVNPGRTKTLIGEAEYEFAGLPEK